MATQDPRVEPPRLVRTSVLLKEDTDKRLRKLAEDNDRPLARELRRAIEEYVEREDLAA